MKRTFALALVVGLSAGAQATVLLGAGVQHKGTPDASLPPLATYGIEVPVRTGLKSLVPTGWRMFIHKSAVLPASLYWKPGDQWSEVLSKAAADQGLSVLVDWDSRTVMIRPLDVALQETAIHAEAMQAARTPLPRFDAPEQAAQAAAPLSTLAAPAVESVAVAPPPEPVLPVAALALPAPAEAPVEAPAASALAALPAEPVAATAPPASVIEAPVVAELAPQAPPVELQGDVLALAESRAPDEEVLVPTSKATAPSAADPAPPLVAQSDEPRSVAAPESVAPSAATALAPAPAVSETPSATAAEAAPAVADASATSLAAEPTSAVPSYRIDADGTVTADNAMTALAVTTQQVDTAAHVGPAARAALLALRSAAEAPVVAPAVPMPAEGTVEWGRPSEPKQASAPVLTGGPVSGVASPAFAPANRATVADPELKVAPELNRPESVAKVEVPASAPAPATSVPAVLAPAEQLTAAAEPVALPALPVFMVNPTPAMVEEREKEAAKLPAPVLRSTPEFTYNEAVALNKPRVRTVAQGIANRFNLRLVWVAPDIKLEGPVTLLAVTAEQDTNLLRKAMGRFSPVSVEVSGSELRVTSKDPAFVARHHAAAAQEAAARAVLQAAETKRALTEKEVRPSRSVAEVVLAPAAEAGSPNGVPGATAKAVPSTGAVSAPGTASAPLPNGAVQLVIEPGDTLEHGLKRLFEARGYTHEWKVNGGFEANRRLTYGADTLTQLLSDVLPPLGVSADIYTVDNHIVIRPGDYRE